MNKIIILFLIALSSSLISCADMGATHSSGVHLKPKRAEQFLSVGEARNAEQLKFSRELAAKVRKGDVDQTYTRRIKVYDWQYKGQSQYLVLAQRKFSNREFFQGPNPASGYHTVRKLYERIYEPNEPLSPQHQALLLNWQDTAL